MFRKRSVSLLILLTMLFTQTLIFPQMLLANNESSGVELVDSLPEFVETPSEALVSSSEESEILSESLEDTADLSQGLIEKHSKQQASPKEVPYAITKFQIVELKTEKPVQTFDYFYYREFRILVDWDATAHGSNLNSGDYFFIELPKAFYLTNPQAFDIVTANGEVIANAVATPKQGGGAEVKVTFGAYVEHHENIKGHVLIATEFNKREYIKTADGNYEISYEFNGQTYTHKILKPNVVKKVLAKWGTRTPIDNKLAWTLRINHKGGTFTNVVINDELSAEPNLPSSVVYLPETFLLKEVAHNEKGEEIATYARYPYTDLSPYLSFGQERQSFSFRMSDFLRAHQHPDEINGTQWRLYYHTTYEPGYKIKNTAVFSSTEEVARAVYTSFFEEGSGTGSGTPVDKIRIKKVDETNQGIVLPHAKFRIENNVTHKVTEVETDENGLAETPKLSQGEYTVTEIVAPLGYILDRTPFVVTIDGNELSLHTITNKRAKLNIPVLKIWQGEESVQEKRIYLFADGKNTTRSIILKKSEGWRGEFKDLPIYREEVGKPPHKIIYSVKEENETDGTIKLKDKWYRVLYSGQMEDGLVITNKELTPVIPIVPLTRDILVTKSWLTEEGKALSAPTNEIIVELYRDGESTGQKLSLNQGNNWQGKFKNLPISSTLGGKAFQYTIKEVGERNNQVDFNNRSFQVSYQGSMKDGYTLINKIVRPSSPPSEPPGSSSPPSKPEVPPPSTVLKVKKLWLDEENNPLTSSVESIGVALYRDGEFTGQVAILNNDNQWQDGFYNLAIRDSQTGDSYRYTVKEVGSILDRIRFNEQEYQVEITGSMDEGYTIINKQEKQESPDIPKIKPPQKPKIPPRYAYPEMPQKPVPKTGQIT